MTILSKTKIVDHGIGTPLNFTIYLFDKFLKKNTVQKKIKKILVLRLGAIGDSIISIPLLRELKKKFPNSKITVLTTSKTGGIYEVVPYVDKVVKFNFVEKKNFLYSGFMNIRGLFKTFFLLKKQKFDLAIDTEQYTRITPLIAYFLKAKKRIGFDSFGEGRGYLFTDKIMHSQDKSEVESFLDLLIPLGIKNPNKNMEFPKQRSAKIDNFLKTNKINKNDFVVAIHAGNSKEFSIKRWPKERFAEVAKNLVENYKAKVILIGAEHELNLVQEIQNLVNKTTIFNSVGLTQNMQQLAYLLSKCSLFIGNDSSPMHLAVAVKTPTITLFGPANEKKWGYANIKGNIVLSKEMSCRPCWARGEMNQKCKYPLPCETAIKVEDVMKAVKSMFKKGRKC